MNKNINEWFDNNKDALIKLSDDIFNHPEVGNTEEYACRRTAEYMSSYGFDVKKIVVSPSKVENGVIARFGSGKPVIGIIGEYDALPGLGQAAVPYRCEIEGPGHGCGHNLMNAACSSAAVALKETMEKENIPGTIVYLACPAEEVLTGKVSMIASGCFDDIDVCAAWHDEREFRVIEEVNQADIMVKFDFHGITAHAAASPHKAKSALDAAQLMNMGVEFLREHVTDDVRMHYVFEDGGIRPNVVPDHASLIYSIREKTMKTCKETFLRVINIAKGAAIMTETTVDYTLQGGCYEPIINHTLNKAMYDAAMKVPKLEYSKDELDFAKQLYTSVLNKEPVGELLPVSFSELTGKISFDYGSSDVNDVSQVIPTVQLYGGAKINELRGHHWSMTASAGSSIGHTAAIYASKILAQFGYDLFVNPDIVKKSQNEHRKTTENNQIYESILYETEPKEIKLD